jgi:cell volume regulation protein A
MSVTEPRITAALLLVAGGVLVVSALLSRLSARSGIPLVLGFVGLGMACGSEGIGGIAFENYRLAFRLGSCGLALILFNAGLQTPTTMFRRYFRPALALATVGVGITAVLVALVAHLLGSSWLEALLLGAIVSSTDAAAVFSVLRAGGVELHERVGAILEVESGLNDPMAVLLTITLTEAISSGESLHASALLSILLNLGIGAVAGLALGWLAVAVLHRVRLTITGLYPVLTIGLALVTFGLTTLLEGSGFLAVYLAAIVIGNAKLPYAGALVRFHDFVAWSGQVVMFVVLGLLAFPSRLVSVALPGLVLSAFGAIVARPLAVAVCLLPFRYQPREIAYVGWVGLKGAVPIVLACIPVIARTPGANHIFDIVFFVVVVSAALQGSTVRALTLKLRLGRGMPRAHRAALEITATKALQNELVVFEIEPASAVAGVSVAEVPFPEGSAAMLLVRADELIAPRGNTVLQPGDVVHVFCRAADRPLLELLFGKAAPD